MYIIRIIFFDVFIWFYDVIVLFWLFSFFVIGDLVYFGFVLQRVWIFVILFVCRFCLVISGDILGYMIVFWKLECFRFRMWLILWIVIDNRLNDLLDVVVFMLIV